MDRTPTLRLEEPVMTVTDDLLRHNQDYAASFGPDLLRLATVRSRTVPESRIRACVCADSI
jgi:hypothetical protein